MSHIFDALERAEAERSGIDLNAFEMPTELLQIVESAAVAPVAEPAAAGADESGIQERETKELPRDAAGPLSPWPQFESLPVSLAPYEKLVSVTEKESLAAEKFRFLAVRLRQLQQRRPLKKLLITSTTPNEGKSLVAANLVCTLASRRQQRTLLLEGDLRRPSLQDQFGLGRISGLSEYLQGAIDAMRTIYRLDSLGFWILPAGGAPQNPLDLMQTGRLSLLMDQLNCWFDWILIDSPPILPLADTSVWTRLADGILLVTRQGITDKEQLKCGLEAIEPSKLVGAVLNCSSNATNGNYYQPYGAAAVGSDYKPQGQGLESK
jgi:capsular exopolysaccharide synthesis family protein